MTDLDDLALRVYKSSWRLKELYTEKQFIENFKNGTLNKIKTCLSDFRKPNVKNNERKGVLTRRKRKS